MLNNWWKWLLIAMLSAVPVPSDNPDVSFFTIIKYADFLYGRPQHISMECLGITLGGPKDVAGESILISVEVGDRIYRGGVLSNSLVSYSLNPEYELYDVEVCNPGSRVEFREGERMSIKFPTRFRFGKFYTLGPVNYW